MSYDVDNGPKIKSLKEQFEARTRKLLERLEQHQNKWSRWTEAALAYLKGDQRPKPFINGNGTILAPRAPTEEDIEQGTRPELYHGPKLKWKAPFLTGMANPSIRKASKDAYSEYHRLRDPDGTCGVCKRRAAGKLVAS